MTESDTGAAIVPATQRAAEPASDSALYSLLPHLARLLRREPALAITVAYLLVAMAGIFYNYRYYAKFNIPVLSLSQISDFLTAGIQRPIALLLLLGTFPVIWLMDAVNVHLRRRQQRRVDSLRARPSRTWWQKLRLKQHEWSLALKHHVFLQFAYAFVVVTYGWTFVAFYADYRASQVREGDAAQVKLRLNGSDADLAASKSPTWTYLGAVSNYIFVYDTAAKRPLILPTNNVTRIEPVRPAAKAEAATAAEAKAGPAAEVAPKP